MLGTKLLERAEGEVATLSGVVRVIELIGTSKVGFDDAIRSAVKRAGETLRHVNGVDVKHMTCAIEDGEITEYRVDLKVAFAIEREEEEEQ
jgi:flavin-binding protein dodecin